MTLRNFLYLLFTLFATKTALAANVGNTLIQQRNHVICGIDHEYSALAYKKDGAWRGFDADLCRAIAAATIGDSESFKLLPISEKNIASALNSGKIDIMFAHQTLSATEESSQNILPVDVLYFDKLVFASRKTTDAQSMRDFANAKVCVLRSSNDSTLLKSYIERHALTLKPLELPALSAVKEAFYLKRCDLIAGSEVFIKSIIKNLKSEDQPELLPEQIGLLPIKAYSSILNPRFNISLKWIFNALKLTASEGISSQNIETFKVQKSDSIRNLLGLDSQLWKKLNLSPFWVEEYIKSFGNYQQLLERNLSELLPLSEETSPNNFPEKGGLLITVPFI